ncbi:MAG: hypothetical protein MUC88_24095 [Planctomycetes bacterium]|nr:hypothetical protein [Planctomycetota bacterium]
MARKTQRISFGERLRSWRNSRAKRPTLRDWNWIAIFKVIAVIGFLAASGAFLRYAEAYVLTIHPAEEGALTLLGVPGWADRNLAERVAEVAGGRRFRLTEETASKVARNLASMAWLDDVDVQVTHDAVRIKARWRKPVALIDIPEDRTKRYVDADLVVLDYLPMPHLPIVEIKGVGLYKGVPLPGQVFDQQDLAAGVALALLLQRMDTQVMPKNPLLGHIASIDVRNFNGRKNPREPHVTLRSKDDTQIIWGAEIGEWTKHLEATDEQKLAKLYAYYRDHGSISAGARYINLRDPQDKVPQPIDKYRN